MEVLEGATSMVESVSFGFFTPEEVRSHAFVKITEPELFTGLRRPTEGGLYDRRLGPLNRGSSCATCHGSLDNCPGHCGYIDLVLPVYNPLLFNFLYKLLQKTCFYCRHLRVDSSLVVAELELILKGDLVGAKRLHSLSHNEAPEESDVSHESCATHSDSQNNDGETLKHQEWTMLQSKEARIALYHYLKSLTSKCKKCGASNPKIGKPTFGWLMSNTSAADIRANVIRGCSLEGPLAGESEGMTDVEDTSEPCGSEETTSMKKHEKKHGKKPPKFTKPKDAFSGELLPSEIKKIMESLWTNEARFCLLISGILQQGSEKKRAGPSIFFLETILVPPIKFRPPAEGGDSTREHSQTVLLSKVLQSNKSLEDACNNNVHSNIQVKRWLELQQSINVLFDSKTAKGSGQKDVDSGICQLLEKKEGLFRQNVMGKRVNHACRSVISPDPYIGVNEIGVPPCFAMKLTYPERVTPWNEAKLRNAVIKGPDEHPGATQYVDKSSIVKLHPSRKKRISVSRTLPLSTGTFMHPGKSSDYEGKIVYRHLQDGDVVLVNRQPTLHKPSIMAHVVRVLPQEEKIIRMHYANCSTYNADFDGDEMNVHFPQDEVSRSEAYNIVNANNQYVRPSNGEPIRTLIQDHIIAAALLTKKDTFLSQDEFSQLLYSSGVSTSGSTFCGKPGQKVLFSCSEDNIESLQPSIWKPVPLWTGKQVIAAVLNHITGGRAFTVEKDGKIPCDFFKSSTSGDGQSNGETGGNKQGKNRESNKVNPKEKGLDEDKMLIYKNDLVRGVIDKAQFGEYGFVHTVQELFGSNAAGVLLSVLSRLFTAFLQMHGFTCGVDDLLIMKSKDDERKQQLESCEKSGEQIHRNFIGIQDDNIKIDPVELQLNIEKSIRSDGESALAYLDRQMINELNSKTSSGVINDLLSDGLLKSSGKNCVSLMTTSGAKGSKVNFQQISSFLGQQELEGKRVPRMVSGKTLPCFHPWDWAARAGGYIIDRFLTGLRPQEYYFHCMAGREGLVDTAVKTSRSGYLQRCLIKNLEGLSICYDHTVRDADGSIVQFYYGEDGVDVHQTSFIKNFEALTANREMVQEKCGCQLDSFDSYILELPKALKVQADNYLIDLKQKQKQKSFSPKLLKRRDFYKLLKMKFFSSLAQPGEPVGVLAAQSVGEPSTQMTLNTFHLAGRGEMNVTLGIPRLQEILMTAASDIKTPIMTCPLQEGRTKEDANRLSDKLKKITVADIVESMEVSVKPFVVENGDICRIYKLEMKLHKPAHYPQYADISGDDWEETLEVMYLRELEDAIQNHLVFLSKISDIKMVRAESLSRVSNETDEDVSSSRSLGKENDDDNDEEDGEGLEDLGMDVKKKTDEMDYEDGLEEELNEGVEESSDSKESSGLESEIDLAEDDTEVSKDDLHNNEVETTSHLGNHSKSKSNKITESPSRVESNSKPKSRDKKKVEAKRKKRDRVKLVKKKFDRAIFVAASAKKFHFEVHFKFTDEPHILLAEIAQKTAKKVCIQNPGKIERCQVIDCKENQVIYYGKDPKERVDVKPGDKQKIPALHAAGVDFNTFWLMQDDLDVRYVYSNNIHAMLNTYGVEAARETIIREVRHVFSSYGISVNMRHLTLIADYMTHSGGYRPMSRLGGIADSTSPFSKMTFETASKFIVEAALHGEIDNLEAPSARICLGLPVKMGTGSFDLIQNLEI